MTQINALLAVEFSFTQDATYDLRFTFAAGASPVNVLLTTATTYKIHLTTAATDALRVLQTAANTALSGAGRAETVAITLTADGLVNIAMTGGSWATIVLSSNLSKLLGIATSATPAASITGSRLPWYVAGFVCAYGGAWQRRAAGVIEECPDGTVYSFASGPSAWRRSVKIEHLPRTPTIRTAESFPGSAAYPDEAYWSAVGSTATDREWSLLDVIANAQNRAATFTTSFQTVRTSTTERYFTGRLGKGSLLAPEIARMDDRWDAFTAHELDFVCPGTAPTGTRA